MTVDGNSSKSTVHSVRLSGEQDQVIRALALNLERDMSWVIRKLLDKAIAQLPNKKGRIDL
jgi:predicted DNA-binding protein